MKERRRYPRYTMPFKIKYATLGLANIESSSTATNISKSGIRMSISRLIKVNDKLRLEIDPNDSKDPINAIGRVVWSFEVGKYELDAGLAFTKLNGNDSTRLLNAFQAAPAA